MKTSVLSLLVIGLISLSPFSNASEEMRSEISLLRFGIQERFTFRSNQNSVNFSTLVSWDPQKNFSNLWGAGASIGFSEMRNLNSNFLAIRYTARFYYLGFSDRIHPEVFAGAETWATTNGSTYPLIGAYIHFSPSFEKAFLDKIESIFVGYQQIFSTTYSSNQLSVGIQISI